MKKLIRVALALFVSGLIFRPLHTSAQGAETRCPASLSSIHEVFAKAVITLQSITLVPVRLPICVSGLSAKDDVHAIVKSVDKDGYVVILAATQDCEGQHVCSYGTMIGTSRPLDQMDAYDVRRRPRTEVKLRGGFTGFYYASVCAAYCSDSFVTWNEGNYHYIIGLKAEKRSNLIASVNSAIQTIREK